MSVYSKEYTFPVLVVTYARMHLSIWVMEARKGWVSHFAMGGRMKGGGFSVGTVGTQARCVFMSPMCAVVKEYGYYHSSGAFCATR
jgi:hypothetical protein